MDIASLVCHMAWTKNGKEKTKNKLMSVLSPVPSHDHEGSPVGKEVKLRWEGYLLKR